MKTPARTGGPPPTAGPRLQVEVYASPTERSTLAADVLQGLGRRPYHLTPKHFYDDVGSRLFDQICDTPEYYLTRAETALLARVAPALVRAVGASDLVELGSGAARKTGLLLDALVASQQAPRYVPLELNEAMVRTSATALLARYPTLRVHGIVGDYERHLAKAPPAARRLVAFLGSTIGNFEPAEAVRFLRALAAQLTPGDRLLLGMDLVKDRAVLERAYNDAQGLTAAFNRNVLAVINRTLGGTFDPAAFEHHAFYDPVPAQIEMQLRARQAHTVRIAALDLAVPFEAGEPIRTEISRKFTRDTAEALLEAGGFALERWERGLDGAFALALGRPKG
jgi:L-histidine N-alpha-methyltransferase